MEIDAYQVYLEGLEENISEEEIFFEVLLILNSETELVDKRLHELMMQSLARRVSEEDAKSANIDRWGMLDVFANQVKLIASNETIDEAVEEAYWEFEDYPKKHLVKKESIKDSLVRFAPFAKDEINAYKFALSLQEQDAEIPMILGTVRQLLGLED